jgi:hypothetical protein
MNRTKSFLLTVAASATLIAGTASAGTITITVIPALSPNALDAMGNPSTSYANWVTNADNALQAGPPPSATAGNPTDPSYYAATTGSVGTGAITTTGDFNSWLGSVNAATGAYANETGNALRFGVIITDVGGTFTLNDLRFSISDPVGDFTFGPVGGYDFGTQAGLLGFNGTTAVTDDNAALTSLFYSGSGTSLEADCIPMVDCNAAAEQLYINDVLANNSLTPFQSDVLTGTYTINNADDVPVASGSATFTIVSPEPSTWFLIVSAIPAVATLRRRRKNT